MVNKGVNIVNKRSGGVGTGRRPLLTCESSSVPAAPRLCASAVYPLMSANSIVAPLCTVKCGSVV